MRWKHLFSQKRPPVSRWSFVFLLIVFCGVSGDLARGISSHSRIEIWFEAIMVAICVPVLVIYAIRLLWERYLSWLWFAPIAALYIADLTASVKGDWEKTFLGTFATLLAQLPLALMKAKRIPHEPGSSAEPGQNL